MFKALQVRRVASRLTDAFPDITDEVARRRAKRLLTAGPLTTDFASDHLISGERLARVYEELRTIRP